MNILGISQLPFIPFIHSPEDIVFVFFIFMRIAGLFLISPIFSNRAISKTVQSYFSAFVTGVLTVVLYPQYLGENAIYHLPELNVGEHLHILMIFLTAAKELAIGYILGLSFSLIFESLLHAGQICSFMMGLAISKMLDPVSGTQQTLLGQLFMILGTLIMLSLDIHHIFLNILAESFSVLPIGTYHLPHEALHTLSHGTMRIFDYAIKLSAIPFTILTLVTIGLGFMAKIMPEMNIFMVGFPLKIFIGYYTLIMAVSLFPLILKQGFYEFENMAKILISQIAGGP